MSHLWCPYKAICVSETSRSEKRDVALSPNTPSHLHNFAQRTVALTHLFEKPVRLNILFSIKIKNCLKIVR